jgi:KDO2-lipid IV(A) lauroyltransferase
MNRLRSRNGAGLAPMNMVVRQLINNRKANQRCIYSFMSDQTPAKAEIEYYTSFLNQETPVFLGIEKLAGKYDMAVVIMNVEKIKRGYYTAKAELLFESTSGLPQYLVTDTHVKRLEEIIKKNPEYWIWTHRRWKYKKTEL